MLSIAQSKIKNVLHFSMSNIVPLYGTFENPPPIDPFTSIFQFITSSTFIIASFVLGFILFLISNKKIFIYLPLIILFLIFCLKIIFPFS